MMNSKKKQQHTIRFSLIKSITYNDDEDFSYKEMFFYNLDIDIKIHFDEFYYFDVDQVDITNEIFDYINHIEKLKNFIFN